jgi:glycerol-3-phosphate dehydrogenase (NAD(P)+)
VKNTFKGKSSVAETELKRIAVIGAGSWGTALANLLAAKEGVDVKIWALEKEVYEEINDTHTNHLFLPDVRLSPDLKAVSSFEMALQEKQLVVLVTPSHVFREVLKGLKSHLTSDMFVMMATKGIENDSLMIMSQVADDVLGSRFLTRFACIAGPSFAGEVSRKFPTAVSIACESDIHGKKIQELFSNDFFRVYLNNDMVGTQLGGALKNVIAIAAGVADGLNFGNNARAALITRGLAEITRLGVKMGANPHTFAGLAGMGDLVLTCTGDMSRNRNVGLQVGKGKNIQEITSRMNMVAEGIKTAKSAYELSIKMNVTMPIVEQVYDILYDEKNPQQAVKELMTRDLKTELEN